MFPSTPRIYSPSELGFSKEEAEKLINSTDPKLKNTYYHRVKEISEQPFKTNKLLEKIEKSQLPKWMNYTMFGIIVLTLIVAIFSIIFSIYEYIDNKSSIQKVEIVEKEIKEIKQEIKEQRLCPEGTEQKMIVYPETSRLEIRCVAIGTATTTDGGIVEDF